MQTCHGVGMAKMPAVETGSSLLILLQDGSSAMSLVEVTSACGSVVKSHKGFQCG